MAKGDTPEDPIVADGLGAAYSAARKALGLSSVDAAKRKRLGIAGMDADGLFFDVYEHAGKRVYVSPYGGNARVIALAERQVIAARAAELEAQGLSQDEILMQLHPGMSLEEAPEGSLPPGVLAAPRR